MQYRRYARPQRPQQRRARRSYTSPAQQRTQGLPATSQLIQSLKLRLAHIPDGARLTLGALALLVVAGLFVGFAGANRAPSTKQQQAQLASAITTPAALPSVGHWIDTADNTVYNVQFQATNAVARLGNRFTFTIPTGEQVVGNIPVFTLADGTLAQEVIDTASAPTIVPPLCRAGVLQSDAPQGIVFAFAAHISADGLAAFATLSYASSSDKQGISSVCVGQAGAGVTTYQMSSGCTLTDCTDLASLVGPTVTAHDNAVLAAEQNNSVANWNAVYKLTSRQVTAQYSPEDFASLFDRQIASVGKISAISAPLIVPTVQFTPEGQAYFSVQQKVTVEHNGAKSTQTLTSYYVLESGNWHFWFTQ